MSASGVRRSMLILLPVVAAGETIMAAHNAFVLPAPANIVLPALQMGLVAGMLLAWWYMWRHRLSAREIDNTVLAILLYLGLLLPAEQAITHNGLLAANLALVFSTGGALLTTRSHFLWLAAVLTTAWTVVVATVAQSVVPVSTQGTYIVLGLLTGFGINLIRVSDRRALQRARDEALHSAMRDDLTGLWNRRGLSAVFGSMTGAAHELDAGLGCIFIDVRGLKAVNDSCGHTEGDALLRAVGSALSDVRSIGGVPVRWGGDEFCIVGVGSAPPVE